MMFKQHVLCALTLTCSGTLFANIPIESRGLSGADNGTVYTANNTAIQTGAGSTPTPTNLNWQLMQKNQQLENELRSLRGKMEEQDNIIEQLKSELTNRYADLDQRLELLQQKVDPSEDTEVAEDNQQGTAPSSS